MSHKEQVAIAVERIPPDETGAGYLRIVRMGLTGEENAGCMVPLGRSGVDPATVNAQLGAALARALPEGWLDMTSEHSPFGMPPPGGQEGECIRRQAEPFRETADEEDGA